MNSQEMHLYFGLRDENLMHKFIAEEAKNRVKLLESAKQTVSTFKPQSEVHQLRH